MLDLDWSVLPYSPDLVSSDFHLFHSLVNTLNDKFFKKSGKNICGKFLELKTSWILLERNQQVTW